MTSCGMCPAVLYSAPPQSAFVNHRDHSYNIAMELVEDAETATWLEGFAGLPGDFDWDAGNRAKNRKHGVESSDVEALFMRPILFAGRIVTQS